MRQRHSSRRSLVCEARGGGELTDTIKYAPVGWALPLLNTSSAHKTSLALCLQYWPSCSPARYHHVPEGLHAWPSPDGLADSLLHCRIKHREISALIKELGQDVVEQRLVDAQDTPLQPQFQLVTRMVVCPAPS